MASNKQSGDIGEKEVVDLISCPNCGKKLMLLPPNYPMYDVQCTACIFRAQVKTNNCKPKNIIFGAGWRIMEKVLKAGYLIPPLFTVFCWNDGINENKEIRLYPFIPKSSIKPYKLSENAKRANYEMFRYEKLDQIPYFTYSTIQVRQRKISKSLGITDVWECKQNNLPEN